MLTQDEAELYDRQIRLWGVNAQGRIRESKVLMLGFNGVASEVAKILVLAGIDTLTIVDDQPLQENDLESNLFCRPSKSTERQYRTDDVKSKLKVLNPLVKVNIDNSPITSKTVSDFENYDLVTLHSFMTIDEISKIDEFCRSSKTKFYLILDYGFFGFVFNDLGDEFKFTYEQFGSVNDQQISSQNHGSQKDPISLDGPEDDQDDIGYASSDNEDEQPRKKRRRHQSPAREPVTKSEDTKQTIVGTLSYVPFRDMISLKNSLFTKQTNPSLLVSIAMLKFFTQYKHLPRGTPDKDRQEDTSRLNEIIVSMKDSLNLHDKIFERLEKSWSENIYGSLSPVCAVVGGVAGQDLIRALSNKDIPIVNTFSFDGIAMNGTVEKVGLAPVGDKKEAATVVRDLVEIDID